MQHRIVQPTKEQVRAYMTAREAARRPPPPPDEIRRLLGWHLDRPQLPFRAARILSNSHKLLHLRSLPDNALGSSVGPPNPVFILESVVNLHKANTFQV